MVEQNEEKVRHIFNNARNAIGMPDYPLKSRHFISATCGGEICGHEVENGSYCGEPATHKVGEEVDEIKLYLRCKIAYYDKCAKDSGRESDAIRAQMCRIILEDLNQKGRIALTIDRLRRFLPADSKKGG